MVLYIGIVLNITYSRYILVLFKSLSKLESSIHNMSRLYINCPSDLLKS